LADELGNDAAVFVDVDHNLVRFYIPAEARWAALAKVTTSLGQYLTDAMRAVARHNPEASGRHRHD
jgi:type I restriction enzyme M protein